MGTAVVLLFTKFRASQLGCSFGQWSHSCLSCTAHPARGIETLITQVTLPDVRLLCEHKIVENIEWSIPKLFYSSCMRRSFGGGCLIIALLPNRLASM